MRGLVTRRRAIAAVIVVVLAGGGIWFWTGRTTAAPQYRTVQASLGTVTQTINVSGTLAVSDVDNLDFGGSGRVTSVGVGVGDKVTQGEVLSTIDTASESVTLSQAEAQLASAEAKLTQDQSGSGSSGSGSSGSSAQLQQAQNNFNNTMATNQQQVGAAQNSATAAQNAVNADIVTVNNDQSTVNSDQSAVNAACPGASCSADQAQLASDQQKLSQDENTEATAQSTAATAANALSSALVKAQQSIDTAMQQLAQAESASSQSGNSSASSSQIASDEAAVQSDQLAVTNDQNSINDSTLVAPANGTVASVSVVVGQTVGGTGSSGAASSSSATHDIVIVPSAPSFVVNGSVSDADINEVQVGQRVQATPTGATEAVNGTLTSIAPVATVTSGVASFPFTATLASSSTLHGGAGVTLSIIVNQQSGVITVPTSTVHTSGGNSTVQELSNGSPTSVTVTLGAQDATLTQIISGVNVGDTIVVAQITSTVPSSGSGNSLFGGGGGGRGNFGGGGGGGVVAP